MVLNVLQFNDTWKCTARSISIWTGFWTASGSGNSPVPWCSSKQGSLLYPTHSRIPSMLTQQNQSGGRTG
ncbi:unnamed protein product [Prunus armeniaca]|uniref:Uncharacterized protein n=1 Tax=Prunus armeniaca TaxID=36596 RepID=A0A6J5TFP3_PRUAR|nr:unnamed protein product [Prunus armeniaca]